MFKAAERSIRAATEGVEPLPHYQEEREVMKCAHTNSGSLLIQGTTPLPMPTTQHCLAYPEYIQTLERNKYRLHYSQDTV